MRPLSKWIQQRKWELFLGGAFIVGILLRIVFVEDMEYKEDEEYNFTQTQLIGNTQPWPWYGIPSGVYLVNPGMSVWVFVVLAKLFGIHHPTSLATALQLFSLLGMSLVIPFALKTFEKEERKVWFWAFALAMVNPFLILYQRKLWPEPFLPFFTMVTLIGWWSRNKRWGAGIWGMIGAWLGQIHMSGFFFSAALFVWTAVFGNHKLGNKSAKKPEWVAWFFGSVLGALPLMPWLIYILQHPVQESMTAGWGEIRQLKYWTFWLTDPLGLHLGNPIGLLRGESNWAQISDFVRYPLIAGQATYVVGVGHAVAFSAAAAIFFRGLIQLFQSREKVFPRWIGLGSETAFVQNSALWGCGILLTLTGVVIRRYYMAVTFPLEFLFLIRMANSSSRTGSRLLVALWIAELIMSAGFVHYIHVNQGSIYGDYGTAYHSRYTAPH